MTGFVMSLGLFGAFGYELTTNIPEGMQVSDTWYRNKRTVLYSTVLCQEYCTQNACHHAMALSYA